MAEIHTKSKSKAKKKQSTYLGWISMLLALTGYLALPGLIVAIYALKSEKHDNVTASTGLAFSAVIVVYPLLVLMWALLFG